MANQLVSICIPCHNAASYVGQAVESILAQSWPHIEIIVVNDGSTDESAEVLRGYRSSNVELIHASFGNAAKARNAAFAIAQGDWIKFFDADDLLNPEAIESQMDRLGDRVDAVASSAWGRFYGDDIGTFSPNHQSVWRDMAGVDWLVEAWKDAQPMTQPGIFLIPRSLLDKVGAWNESDELAATPYDDFEFFARVLSGAKEVLFTADAVLYYRSGLQGSLSGRRSPKAVEAAYHTLIQGTEQLLARRSDPCARRSCANLFQNFIYTHYPDHAELRAKLLSRIEALGGSDLEISGGPRFHQLRRLVGWKAAKRLQKLSGRA